MKPTTLRKGDTIKMEGIRHNLSFVRREPRSGSFGARNIFVCAAWAGMNGPDDKGECAISDFDVSRKCLKVSSGKIT